MKCERCHQTMAPEEARDYNGQRLCEDCYMDMLSPARACDPWAALTAKSAARLGGEGEYLTGEQQRILDILRAGPAALEDLAEKTGRKPADLERDLAALHHMAKVGGALLDGRQKYLLWTAQDEEDDDAAGKNNSDRT